jgi:hypothetical protein
MHLDIYYVEKHIDSYDYRFVETTYNLGWMEH